MSRAETREWVDRREAREWLMRFLYAMDVHGMVPLDLEDWFSVFASEEDPGSVPVAAPESAEDTGAEDVWPVWEESHRLSESQKAFVRDSAQSVLANLEEIDGHIVRWLKGWEYSRVPRVDRAILRLATNEILFNEKIPVGASINEAVELSKRYSSDASFRFLNGVLGNIAREGEV